MKQIKISKIQKEIIMGTILGDGHLETRTKGKTYRLKIEHAYSQKEYVDWLYEQLKTLAVSEPRIKITTIGNKNYQKYWFNSVATDSLRFYAQQFYQENKKVVPKLIHRWLTPLAIAVWFMDDGSIKSKHHRAKILNTQSFEKEEIKRLIKVFDEKYGIKAKLRKQKEGYQIYLLAETIDKFEDLIRPYIIPSMMYKLG